MSSRFGWAWLLAVMAPAAAASDWGSLIDLPVSGATVVPSALYRDASRHAALSAAPVEIALRIAGPFEGARQLLAQTNVGAESPSASRVTVVRDGLLDDALRSERWDIELLRTAAGQWEIRQVTRAWRCWRGVQAAGFAGQPCP